MSRAASNGSHCLPDRRELILASGSPQRQDLLRSLGLVFQADPSTASEEVGPGLGIAEVVATLATSKALAVAPRHPEALIIAADTLVGLDTMVFGKPQDAEEARAMLRHMSGRSHRVLTGLVALDVETMTFESKVVETEVDFRPIGKR